MSGFAPRRVRLSALTTVRRTRTADVARTSLILLVLFTAGSGVHPQAAYAQQKNPRVRTLRPGVARPASQARDQSDGAPVDVRVFKGPALAQPEPEFSAVGSLSRTLDRVDHREGVPRDGGPISTPRPIGAAQMGQIRAALGSLEPGSQYVRVTPSQPSVTGKAALVFVEPHLVEGGQGYVQFFSEELRPPGLAVLWIRSPQARRYLIDCAISGTSYAVSDHVVEAGPVLAVTGPDSATQIFDFSSSGADPAGNHLLFGLEAEEIGWYRFTIAWGDQPSSRPGKWELHSCEVTNL